MRDRVAENSNLVLGNHIKLGAGYNVPCDLVRNVEQAMRPMMRNSKVRIMPKDLLRYIRDSFAFSPTKPAASRKVHVVDGRVCHFVYAISQLVV